MLFLMAVVNRDAAADEYGDNKEKQRGHKRLNRNSS